MKRIMILGGGILQVPAIRKAKEMGLSVVVVDMNPEAVGFKEDGVIKEVISTIDIPAVLKAAQKHHIDGIMTLASDMPMRTIAAVSKELGLVGITEDTALKATNKAVMRKTLFEQHVPVPMFFKVETEEETVQAVLKVHNQGYRCIIKPADNSGSRGVTLLSDCDKKTILSAYHNGINLSRSGALVVEEYMEGPEVSVETISVDGVCHVIQITDKLTTGAPYFVEMGHSQPSMLSEDIKNQIKKVAKDAVRAIGIENGPSHTEIKVTKDGPKIVELGARLGGDCITTHLVPLSTGVNMVECCINIAMGEKPDIEQKWNKGSAIRYFKTEIGEIREISGIENAEKLDGIQHVCIVHGVGDEAKEIKSSTDRIGFVISCNRTSVDAVSVAQEAILKVRFGVKAK